MTARRTADMPEQRLGLCSSLHSAAGAEGVRAALRTRRCGRSADASATFGGGIARAPSVPVAVLAAIALLLGASAGTVRADEVAAPIEAYLQAVHAAVMRHWVEPPGTSLRCRFAVDQHEGGAVVQVSFGDDCNADAASRDALRRAVQQASPLPYAGHERVFQRRLQLVFQSDGH